MSKNQKALIFSVGVVRVLAGWVALVYGLLGNFDAESQRIVSAFVLAILWPISVVVAVVVTRRLTRREVEAHDQGMDRALDKVAKTAADVATIRTAMHTTIRTPPAIQTAQPAARGWDELLPKRAVIVTRQDDDTTPIEL